jgi:hypothetical protein
VEDGRAIVSGGGTQKVLFFLEIKLSFGSLELV